jgi:hypothetical protein
MGASEDKESGLERARALLLRSPAVQPVWPALAAAFLFATSAMSLAAVLILAPGPPIS